MENHAELYDDLRTILFNDNAVAGEAAGYGMGLVMLGTGSAKALDEMLQYAHETQHEKIIRGLAVGIALLVYGLEGEADSVIDQLLSDAVSRSTSHRIIADRVNAGSDTALRWRARHRSGLCWHGKQPGDAPAPSPCCV